MAIFEPATYKVCELNNFTLASILTLGVSLFQVAMNIKIVITGGLTQLVFGKKLSGTQWVALTLLAIGCRHLPTLPPLTQPSTDPPPLPQLLTYSLSKLGSEMSSAASHEATPMLGWVYLLVQVSHARIGIPRALSLPSLLSP